MKDIVAKEKENIVLKKHLDFCKKWPCTSFGVIYLQQLVDEINKDSLNENEKKQFENIEKELTNLQNTNCFELGIYIHPNSKYNDLIGYETTIHKIRNINQNSKYNVEIFRYNYKTLKCLIDTTEYCDGRSIKKIENQCDLTIDYYNKNFVIKHSYYSKEIVFYYTINSEIVLKSTFSKSEICADRSNYVGTLSGACSTKPEVPKKFELGTPSSQSEQLSCSRCPNINEKPVKEQVKEQVKEETKEQVKEETKESTLEEKKQVKKEKVEEVKEINFDDFHKKETEMRWKAMDKCENGWDGDLWLKICNESANKHLKLLDYVIQQKRIQESILEKPVEKIVEKPVEKIVVKKIVEKPVEKKIVENELKINVYENTQENNEKVEEIVQEKRVRFTLPEIEIKKVNLKFNFFEKLKRLFKIKNFFKK